MVADLMCLFHHVGVGMESVWEACRKMEASAKKQLLRQTLRETSKEFEWGVSGTFQRDTCSLQNL